MRRDFSLLSPFQTDADFVLNFQSLQILFGALSLQLGGRIRRWNEPRIASAHQAWIQAGKPRGQLKLTLSQFGSTNVDQFGSVWRKVYKVSFLALSIDFLIDS